MTTLEQTSIYSQETWDHEYQDLEFRLPPYQDQIRRWLTEWAPKNKAGSCFEVGCFPGQYLAVFGEMGFEVNGADLPPRVFPEMANWLDCSGDKVGQIYR